MADVPATPHVISPTPSASETTADSYFPPTTRSAAKRHTGAPEPLTERTSRDSSSSSSPDPDARHGRSRSRSVDLSLRARRMSGKKKRPPADGASAPTTLKTPPNGVAKQPNGYLSPTQYLREISRSPSPLGLIPLHRTWRQMIHKYELPRKVLHVSIGFLTLRLYSLDYQASDIHPSLLYLLVPIATVDLLRHNWPPFNRFYVRMLGAFMRESEVHAKYNGVIWYLLGTWVSMRFFPKDVGVMSIVLLSWCDTAASTVGRWLGRYTPRVRKGKSLAGSLAALLVGVVSAWLFFGWLAPRTQAGGNQIQCCHAFHGRLSLPDNVKHLIGWRSDQGVIEGTTAVGVMSLVAGVVASVGEAIDIGGLDDNVTIPILCGLGLWGFLKIFG